MTLALPSRRAVLAPGPWVRNELWRRARAVPSLDLRFAENKSLVDAVTGQSLVTFTRASAGTYVGSDGLIKTAVENVPRFTHDPVTGESLGLLVEEQRTNLLLRSEEFGDANWAKPSSTVSSNSTAGPDGAITADLLITNNATSNGLVQQIIAKAASPITYTFSCYGKEEEFSSLRLILRDPANSGNRADLVLNLATGSTSGSFVGGTYSSLSSYVSRMANGWWRFSITATTGSESSVSAQVISNGAGDGTSGIYIWGAQLEVGAFPTSYIPTTTAAVTRSADVVSITGSAFSSWYRQDEGTVFANYQFSAGSAVNTNSRQLFDSSDGTTDNRFSVRGIGGASTADQITARSGASTVAQFFTNGTAVGTAPRAIAAVYRLDDYAAVATGSASAVTDTSGALPVGLNQTNIGGAVNGTEYLCGTIRRLTYWPQRLPNSTLQTITL